MKLLTVALLFSCTLGAQTEADKGKQLIDRAVAALGGDRFLQMQNIVESGRVYNFFRGELNALEVAKTYVEYLNTSPPGG